MNMHPEPAEPADDAPEPASSDRLWLEVLILASTAAGRGGSEQAGGNGRSAEAGLRPTVLVVASEADLRAYIRECLDGTGLNVVDARDIATGLVELGNAHPDLIILDAATSAGAEVASGEGTSATVARILVSDEPPRRGVTRPRADGSGDTVLMKPFNARRLRAEVAQRLGRATAVDGRSSTPEGGETP